MAAPAFTARGFTVMEMLLVVMILALLMTMVVPRLTGQDTRQFRLACDQVADMLTMLAKRESLSQKPLGLSYNAERHWLSVLSYDIDRDSGETEPRWRHDPALPPVKLPEVAELVEVRADGDLLDISRWPLTTTPGEQRPMIEVLLRGPDDEEMTIMLPPYSVAPRQFAHNSEAPVYHTPIDLSSGGRSREEW